MDDSLCLPGETWKEIEGFPGYEISDMGRVRSFYKRAWRDWEQVAEPQRILKGAYKKREGYHFVSLRRLGVSYTRPTHQLVLEAFVGPCPDGQESCHNDGDPRNNYLSNLRYDTHLENMHDAIEHGSQIGKIGSLSEQDVVSIRTRFTNGELATTLADEYGFSQNHIQCICSGASYSDFGGPLIVDRHRKLTTKDAHQICLAVNRDGYSQVSQALRYEVSESIISLIVNGKRHQQALDRLKRKGGR